MSVMQSFYAGVLFLLLVATPSFADEFQGRVVHIHDGDTAHVDRLSDGERIKVRFLFVDTPEIGQEHGIEARDFLREWIGGEIVTVRTDGVDQHGRALGELFYEGESVNKKLIEEGHGWWFYHYDQLIELGELEIAAKAAEKGLWASRNPIYPRNWRAGARVDGSGVDSSGPSSSNSDASASPQAEVFIMAAMPNPRSQDEGNETVILANRNNESVSLSGWKLQDDDDGEVALSGAIEAGGVLTIRLTSGLQLGNSGDKIQLVNASGETVHELDYSSSRAGVFVMAR